MKTHSRKIHPTLPLGIVQLPEHSTANKIEAFNCMYCSCTALSLNSLSKHWSDAHKASNLTFMYRKANFPVDAEYECFWCRKRKDIRSLSEHCMSDHNSRYVLVRASSLTKLKYKCSECSLVFNSVDILRRHFAMDHPAKQFSYVTVDKPGAITSGSVQTTNSNQSRQIPMYKCFNCHFVSPMYWVMVKHLHTHFVTYACVECDALFTTMYSIRKHITTTHPGSTGRPTIIKGTERDIENAKTNIIVTGEFGIKRKITSEELIQAEKEDKMGEQSLEMYSYDQPLAANVSLPMRGTARKSTSPVKKVSKQLEQPKSLLTKKENLKKSLRTVRRKKSLNKVFAVFSYDQKKVKLPADKMIKMLKFRDKVELEHVVENS